MKSASTWMNELKDAQTTDAPNWVIHIREEDIRAIQLDTAKACLKSALTIYDLSNFNYEAFLYEVNK